MVGFQLGEKQGEKHATNCCHCNLDIVTRWLWEQRVPRDTNIRNVTVPILGITALRCEATFLGVWLTNLYKEQSRCATVDDGNKSVWGGGGAVCVRLCARVHMC